MKPFNLEEYLTNPTKKLITRDGRKVKRVLCTNVKSIYSIVAVIENHDGNTEQALSFTKDGKYFYNQLNDKDLFFASEKKEGWINIFKGASDDNLYVEYARIFKSKEDAEKEGEGYSNHITTLKIEWEE